MSEWLHLAGDIVEDLVVLRPLGRGGFGEVYLARSVHEEEDEELYAIKALRPTLVQDRGWRERFGREANIWIDLEDHPYVVRAHAVLEVSGRLYIVLDYVHPDASGMNSLGQYLEHRPPDVIQALRWAIQFCLGMEYAYTRGLRSHRDIKPDNILISRGQTVRISDFGIASAGGTPERPPDLGSVQTRSPSEGSRLTGAGTGFGSLLYMPPEQFLDAAGCDE
jgi:serine/threonine protein kinase